MLLSLVSQRKRASSSASHVDTSLGLSGNDLDEELDAIDEIVRLETMRSNPTRGDPQSSSSAVESSASSCEGSSTARAEDRRPPSEDDQEQPGNDSSSGSSDDPADEFELSDCEDLIPKPIVRPRDGDTLFVHDARLVMLNYAADVESLTRRLMESPAKRWVERKECSVCLRAFDPGNAFLEHIRTHTGERPYSCKYCGRGFTNKVSESPLLKTG